MVRSEWKDISTAPTDGTEILVCGGATGSDLYAADPSRPMEGVAHVRYVDYWFCKNECWRIVNAVYYAAWVENPTHWMPMPKTVRRKGE